MLRAGLFSRCLAWLFYVRLCVICFRCFIAKGQLRVMCLCKQKWSWQIFWTFSNFIVLQNWMSINSRLVLRKGCLFGCPAKGLLITLANLKKGCQRQGDCRESSMIECWGSRAGGRAGPPCKQQIFKHHGRMRDRTWHHYDMFRKNDRHHHTNYHRNHRSWSSSYHHFITMQRHAYGDAKNMFFCMFQTTVTDRCFSGLDFKNRPKSEF